MIGIQQDNAPKQTNQNKRFFDDGILISSVTTPQQQNNQVGAIESTIEEPKSPQQKIIVDFKSTEPYSLNEEYWTQEVEESESDVNVKK